MSMQAVLSEDGRLSPMQAAVQIDCSLSYLYRQLRDGALPGIQSERGWRIDPEELATYAKAKAERRALIQQARQAYPDEVIDELATEFIRESIRLGKLPEKPSAPLLGRIARAIRTAEVA